MSLIKLQIPPGFHRNGTDFESSNRWRDGNLVRWRQNSLRPIGGWTDKNTTGDTITGKARAMFGWRDNDLDGHIAIGTESKLYHMTPGGAVKDITPTGFTAGNASAVIITGYGGSYFGTGYYGNKRADAGVYSLASTWALDNWGEYLLGCMADDGKIYEWQLDYSTPTLPTALTNAPIDNRAMMVTEERFVFALGAGGNPRKVQWCDQENNTVWTPAATNQAGDIELQTTGSIMCGVRVRGRALILTDSDAHIGVYQGAPFVYGFERVGNSCGISSQKGVVAVDEGAFWMGHKSFYIFDGSVAKELPCEVSDYVFADINQDQISKTTAIHNSEFNEIWWFYPSEGSTENDKYVAFDYVEGNWSIGTLDRTSGIDVGVFSKPLWIDSGNDLYNQETGWTHGTEVPFAETAPISLGNGDQLMRVNRLIPDEETQGEVEVKFKTRNYPNATETTYGAFTMANPTSVRFQGRQIRMRIEGITNTDWRAGIMRIEARPGSKR